MMVERRGIEPRELGVNPKTTTHHAPHLKPLECRLRGFPLSGTPILPHHQRPVKLGAICFFALYRPPNS
jgi:hypothetical protein